MKTIIILCIVTNGLRLNKGGVRKYPANLGKFIKYC